MLGTRKFPLVLILFVLFCVIGEALAKKHKHKHKHKHGKEEEEGGGSGGGSGGNEEVKEGKPDYKTPRNEEWLKGIDFSIVKGKVRPVGSGTCKDAKCDASDHEKCFETCGNLPTPEDIYGCPAEKTWALTFDDGPSNFTNSLLDALDKTNVKVTFCVMGAHAKQYPDVIKRAYNAGHQIASHTYSHAHLMSLSNEEIVYEVRATEEAIKQAIGVKPKYIRPPYGEADGRVKAILKQMGYRTLMWNVDPTDYNVHMLPDGAQRIQGAFDSVTQGTPTGLNAHDDLGFISLQHDLYKTSIDQVPVIISKFQQMGYKFTTTAECVGDPEPHQKLIMQDDKKVEVEKAIKQDAVEIAKSPEEKKVVKQAEQPAVAKSSANTLTTSIITFVLAFISSFYYF